MIQNWVEYWVEKTKREVGEEVRKKKIQEAFEQEFGFAPNFVGFNAFDQVFACSEFEIDIQIEGRKINRIRFSAVESLYDKQKEEPPRLIKSYFDYHWYWKKNGIEYRVCLEVEEEKEEED